MNIFYFNLLYLHKGLVFLQFYFLIKKELFFYPIYL